MTTPAPRQAVWFGDGLDRGSRGTLELGASGAGGIDMKENWERGDEAGTGMRLLSYLKWTAADLLKTGLGVYCV